MNIQHGQDLRKFIASFKKLMVKKDEWNTEIPEDMATITSFRTLSDMARMFNKISEHPAVFDIVYPTVLQGGVCGRDGICTYYEWYFENVAQVKQFVKHMRLHLSEQSKHLIGHRRFSETLSTPESDDQHHSNQLHFMRQVEILTDLH